MRAQNWAEPVLNRCVLHVFTTRKNTEYEGETLARGSPTQSPPFELFMWSLFLGLSFTLLFRPTPLLN